MTLTGARRQDTKVSALEFSKAFGQDAVMADANQKKLAAYVIARRVEVGYRTRRALGAAMGVTERTLDKLENGGKVGPSTLGALENALRWEPGSAERILAGGEPVVRGEQPPPRARQYNDPVLQELWDLMADVRITGDQSADEEIKRGAIRYFRGARQDDDDRRRTG
jgi:hypothetical protein